MDIFAIRDKQTAILEVKHPITGEDTGIRIELYSPDSNEYREALNAISKGANKKGTLSFDELKSRSIDILAACTASWENIEDNGKPLECTKENAIMLYTKLSWLSKRVDAFINKEVNFLEVSPSV